MIDGTGTPESLLVLGAGSAIAQAIVRALIPRGMTELVLAARGSVRGAICASDVSVTEVRFEADDVRSHPCMLERVWESHGRIDMALLAFGVMGDPLAADRRGDELRVATTNYLSAISLLRLLATRMTGQGQGSIVVISSAAAFLPRPGQSAYASAKAGLDSFATGLAVELQGTGVELTIVRPGFVHTPLTRGVRPAPFATTPDRVALDVVRGLESGRRVVWSPPVLRPLVGTVRLLPSSIYTRLTKER